MRPQYLLCELCSEAILENPHPQSINLGLKSTCHAPYLYGGPLETMIWRAKFRGREDLAHALGQLLAASPAAKALAARCDLLMPIPLSTIRHFKRGYNQSRHIADILARQWQLPMQTRWSRRHTKAQHQLDRAQRARNIRAAFGPPKNVKNKSILLVDDVVTTGFTLQEAARTLRRAGAREVHAVACAQANWSYLNT